MDIDVSKENIQPLRGGRNLVQLGTALQAQTDADAQRQLLLQKEEHEATIRNYQGSDPLDPWFNYIQWVEQCFPKHGHEGHMDKIIKDCLQLFEKDEKYYQDRRFVKLWIKYVDCLPNPLEVYQRLYNSGIGIECSEFYRAWACYCEELGDYKKANQVYMLGLQTKAQPLDELEQAHMNFQLFFAQRMLHDDSPTKRKAASALAETRQALTSLKSFKRRNIATAPVQRVGDSIRSIIPGVMAQQPAGYDHRFPSSNVMINVYEDGPSTSQAAVPVTDNAGPASLVQALGNVENEKEVGVWTNAKIKMVHANVVPHQPLPFTPYEDEDDALKLPPHHMSHCVDDLVYDLPLCVPDPPDPTKIPCYNKALVYADDTEYSLEEIRARKYNLNRFSKTEVVEDVVDKGHQQSHYENINESFAQCSALETLANCALDAEQDHFSGHLMPLVIPTLQNITKVTNMHSPGEPKVLVNLDSKEFSELTTKANDENCRPSLGDSDKENHVQPTTSRNEFETDNKPNLMEEFNRSLMGNLLADSVTLNTKEARWELRNLFNDNEPTIVQPVVQQYDIPKFDIHEDRSMTIALNTKKKQEMPDLRTLPEDKENERKFIALAAQNVNKTAYYEEPSCTQVFNFNIKDASTPNMSQFKKPTSHIDHSSKYPNVPKFSIDESVIEHDPGVMKREDSSTHQATDHAIADNQGTGLSVIMEATREFNSKSGSSSSGQSTRTNFTGYTTTPYNEKTQASNFDSMYNPNDPSQQPTTSKRSSISTQPRLPNGKFARVYSQKREPENKATPTTSVPYFSHDHQYQKPVAQNYNGYSPQRSMPQHYQHNYSFQQSYGGNQIINQPQQGYMSPNANAYNSSPQHPGMQSPHSVQPGFQSPTYSNQMGYQSPGHPVMSPQHVYARQDYHYPGQQERLHGHVNPQQHPQHQQQQVPHQPPHPQHQQATFQSPPHQTQYQNAQYYHRPNQHPVAQTPPVHNASQQGYQVQNQYNHNMYANPHTNVQNYNAMQNSFRHSPSQPSPIPYAAQTNQQSFQIYQSPQTIQNNSKTVTHSTQEQLQQETVSTNTTVRTPSTTLVDQSAMNKSNQAIGQSKGALNKSPPAVRNQAKNASDMGFSNQFLNFISNRNEPKDNANTPKFTNSPNISQKMHKNLYVSSPEQAQIPPSSGLSDSDSKDGMTAQTVTPIQSAKVSHSIDKQKDLSKRQLDFEHRLDLQSEDSRDSVSKDSRIPSVYSRQSDFQSDGYGMDVDSESSMECAAFKSTHSVSLIETSEIPRPADIDFPDIIDPFNKKLLTSLLDYVKFPNKTHAEGYIEVKSVPKLQTGTVIAVGPSKFSIDKQLGKGNYGAVFLCLDIYNNKSVAVKYQKPARPWEFYICQEIKARIKDPCMLPGYMDITTGFLGDNASLFVSEYSKYGSLLDVANKVRVATSKCMNEFLVFLLTAEMLSIVHYLHKAKIIHADIKPDNFLLMKIPVQEWRTPSLQLIDMGCSIDMSLFPEKTSFREMIATEGFTCIEMREGKPWTYQTDLYCLAGTIHVILLGSYMKVANRLGQWNIEKKLSRYMRISVWDKIFTTLLNVPDCETLPDLLELKQEVDSLLSGADNLGSQLRNLANILKSR